MRLVRLLHEALLPLFVLVILASIAVAGWAQSLSATVAHGNYPPLNPDLSRQVMVHHPRTPAMR